MSIIHTLRTQYRTDKAALLAALAASGSATRGVNAALRGLSKLADAALKDLWQEAGFAAPFAPVSYTHLDVYKRQCLYFLFLAKVFF